MPSPARLAIVLSGLAVVHRGAEAVTLELIRRLRSDFRLTIYSQVAFDESCRVVAAVPRTSPRLAWLSRLPAAVQAALQRCRLSPAGLEDLTYAWGIAASGFLNERFDLLFAGGGLWSLALCRWYAQRHAIPLHYTIHGGLGIEGRLADSLATVTADLAEAARRRFPRARVTWIPNGVDLQTFRPGAVPDQALAGPLERPIFLCCAAFEPIKNLHRLIRAVALLSQGSLILLGQGELQPALQAMGQALLGPARFHMARVPYPETVAYYRLCDVFTLPSERDACPVVLLEALASNKPVVAHDDPWGRRSSVVGSAGLLCDTGDPRVYADHLQRAAHMDWGEQPRQQACRFDWDTLAERYRLLFLDLLGPLHPDPALAGDIVS